VDPERAHDRHVRAPKTGALIASELRKQIIRGELIAGERLPSEIELMEHFDVARPTLREAFRILEAESLLRTTRGARGAQIQAPTVTVAARYLGVLLQVEGVDLGDLYQARTILEPPAAGLLALRRTDTDLLDLTHCVDRLAELIAAPAHVAEIDRWNDASYSFHDMLVERAGNKTLTMQLRVLREVVTLHLSVAVHRSDTDRDLKIKSFRRTVRSFRKLIGFLEAGDAPGAIGHWTAHMTAAGTDLLRGDLSYRTVLELFS
jgi:GntR family transcriptional regulator, transcriptional repressor for pyruvate dehydrogenase complex